MVGSFFEQTVADVYELYEREMHRANAMDFDDLLVRAVNVLELFPEVRDRYATTFRHVLVDEYQDTNHAQYRWLQLLAGEHRNLAVVGDDDQCLVAGTPVTMGDGDQRPIEEVRVGRRGAVLLRERRLPRRPAWRTTFTSRARRASRSRTRGGRAHRQHPGAHPLRRLLGGLDAAAAPDVPDVAAGDGLPRRHVRASTPTASASRCSGCSAAARQRARGRRLGGLDARNEAEARAAEALLSLRYRLPTLPFVARPRGAASRLGRRPGR